MKPIAKLQHLIRKQENIDPEILELVNAVEEELGKLHNQLRGEVNKVLRYYSKYEFWLDTYNKNHPDEVEEILKQQKQEG